MKRLKIDFGIDLGTTNSAIAVMNNSETKIYRSNTLKDTMPSCVMVTKRGFRVGDSAFTMLIKDKIKAFENSNFKSNVFAEFKRTMGNTIPYSTMQGELGSKELSAEVLKTLKTFVKEEDVKAAIITIPADFEMNQINATKNAAELAGIEYVELVQEPYAAAIAYGVESANKNGYWLVFDFGGGTFDSALVNVSDGIIKVIDTEGDSFLGGKNLDEAIVDQIFIPYLKENFSITSIIRNQDRFTAFKEMWKLEAEKAKNELSNNESYDVLVGLYDDFGVDDEGEEFMIDDLTIEREQLKKVIEPYIQKAIDYCKTLLQRNNLDGKSLDELILVGGPTLSPIVREMIEEQIRKPNTTVDPMTVVAKGAATYASNINNPIEEKPPAGNNKVQLYVNYDSMVVGESTFITIKTKGEDKIVYAEIARDDDAFKSEKVEVNNIGAVIELHLKSDQHNVFSIFVYDEKGNKLECEPNTFSIKEGTSPGGVPLPHSVCLEVLDKQTKKPIIKAIKGLEKTKTLPATGVYNGLKTRKQVRPGMEDFIDLPIYQGEPDTKAVLNNHVQTIRITGNDLPALLPKGSIVDLRFEIDRSGLITGKVDFTEIDFEVPFEVSTKESEVTKEWLNQKINETERALKTISSQNNSMFNEKLKEIKRIFESKDTEAGRLEARSELQKVAREIDEIEKENEWPELEKELKRAFHKLEEVNQEKGNEQTNQMVENIRPDVEQAIREQDKKNTPKLIESVNSMAFELERLEHLIGFVLGLENQFDSIPWRDKNAAHSSINRAKGIIYENPSIASLQPIVNNLFENGRFDEKGGGKGPDVPREILRG